MGLIAANGDPAGTNAFLTTLAFFPFLSTDVDDREETHCNLIDTEQDNIDKDKVRCYKMKVEV